MEDTLTKIGLLVVGWLFGLLSPAVVESIRHARDVKPMMESIADELHEFRYTTACTASVLRAHLGTEDAAFHQWFKVVADDYRGVQADEKIRRAAAMFAALSEEQLTALGEYRKVRGSEALGVKELIVPGLEARVPSLWMLPRRAQSGYFDCSATSPSTTKRWRTQSISEMLTFQKLEEGNYELARAQLKRSYVNQADIAQRLANQSALCERGLRKSGWLF